jgi:hypothetical protein
MTTPAVDPATDPTPAATDPKPTEPAKTYPPADTDGTDWKAESRKHEARAKANADAAKELERLKASQMSEQEKAVAAAKAEGLSEAAKTYGAKLAAAHFEAAVARAGLDLGEAADLIDVARFVGDDGEVDDKAIKAAVTKLAKVTSKSAGRSGGDGPPGAGSTKTTPASLDEAVAAHYAR